MALPAAPDTVAAWLASPAVDVLAVSSIGQRCAGVRFMHRAAGFESPTASETVKATMAGIRRRNGTAPARKTPATADLVARLLRSAQIV